MWNMWQHPGKNHDEEWEGYTIPGTHLVYIVWRYGRCDCVYDFKGRLLRGKKLPNHDAISSLIREGEEWFPVKGSIYDDPALYWDKMDIDAFDFCLVARLMHHEIDEDTLHDFYWEVEDAPERPFDKWQAALTAFLNDRKFSRNKHP